MPDSMLGLRGLPGHCRSCRGPEPVRRAGPLRTQRRPLCRARLQLCRAAERRETPSHPSQPPFQGLVYGIGIALSSMPAHADELNYDPSSGADVLKNLAGAVYVLFLVGFLIRLITRRAKGATSVRIASQSGDKPALQEDAKPSDANKATPLAAAWYAALVNSAGVICYLLYLLSQNVDKFFETQTLPDQYTARNISVAIQTVARGAVYLATFIFGANTLGLAALTLQLLLFPELDEDKDGASEQQ